MATLKRLAPAVKSRSRRLRAAMTDAEQRIWHHLRGRQLLNYKFRRQHPVGHYVVDFVCLEARLVIEIDGGQHVDRTGFDQARTDWLEFKGFRVLRFWNHEVLNQLDDVKTSIWYGLHRGAQPPSQPSPCQGEGV